MKRGYGVWGDREVWGVWEGWEVWEVWEVWDLLLISCTPYRKTQKLKHSALSVQRSAFGRKPINTYDTSLKG